MKKKGFTKIGENLAPNPKGEKDFLAPNPKGEKDFLAPNPKGGFSFVFQEDEIFYVYKNK
jgi:hypothetical protein